MDKYTSQARQLVRDDLKASEFSGRRLRSQTLSHRNRCMSQIPIVVICHNLNQKNFILKIELTSNSPIRALNLGWDLKMSSVIRNP